MAASASVDPPLLTPVLPDTAPVINTGGGGITVEKKVGARALLAMLAERGMPGVDLTPITAIQFQARNDGWVIDDVLLESATASATCRCDASAKAGDQFGVRNLSIYWSAATLPRPWSCRRRYLAIDEREPRSWTFCSHFGFRTADGDQPM